MLLIRMQYSTMAIIGEMKDAMITDKFMLHALPEFRFFPFHYSQSVDRAGDITVGIELANHCLHPAVRLKHFIRTLQNGRYAHFKDLLKAGDWMAKVDLKDAYVLYGVNSQEGLTSSCSKKRHTTSTAYHLAWYVPPWVFTKILKPIATHAAERSGNSTDCLHRIQVSGFGPC